MKKDEEIKNLKRKLSREQMLNRIISAENDELKKINFGLLEQINNSKYWYKNTFIYRGLRKIYKTIFKKRGKNEQ